MTQPLKNLTAAEIVAELGRRIATTHESRHRDVDGRSNAALDVLEAVHAAFNADPKTFWAELTHDPPTVTIHVATKGLVPVVALQAADGEIQLQLKYSDTPRWQRIDLYYDPASRKFANGENVVAAEAGSAIASWIQIPGSLG